MNTIEWKRGDSFVVNESGVLVSDPTGGKTMTVRATMRSGVLVEDATGTLTMSVPARLLDMTGWNVLSHIRRKDTSALVCALDLLWTNRVAGAFTLEAKDTTTWPVGLLLWDVQYTDPSGYVASTETMAIKCKADQTTAA